MYPATTGYKICLCTYANGYGNREGAYVSVFICFMKGEFDESLKWPFRGVIAFRLLDQVTGNDHKTDKNTYDDSILNQYCNRVTIGERDSGWGTPKFIAHSELEPKYLHKNTLLFQIHRVELK